MAMNNTEILNAMRQKGAYDAQVLRTNAAAGLYTDTEIIDREEAIPDFDPERDYTLLPIGTPVADNGQVYGLLQPYNAANYPERPAALPAIWGIKHTKNPAHAKPYAEPQGISGLYMEDEVCVMEGMIYRSKVNNNAYSPLAYPGNWEAVM